MPLVLEVRVRTMSGGIRVTATDLEHPDDAMSRDIMDDYVIIAAGDCDVSHVTVHHKNDGSETHVITVKGVRR